MINDTLIKRNEYYKYTTIKNMYENIQHLFLSFLLFKLKKLNIYKN